MPDNGQDLTVYAYPSKSFFIDMLTRDIGLTECILDLIDNSIHSLIVASKLDVMENLLTGKTAATMPKAEINVSFNSTHFKITDTCGGISIQEARERVFLFGRPQHDKRHTGLGVYGIGMKRAFFKVGRKIAVKSNTTTEEFLIEIDVDEWEQKPDEWEFKFTYAHKKPHAASHTSIEITSLDHVAKSQFSTANFENHLRNKISMAYALFIEAGLTIKVNKKAAVWNLPDIGESTRVRSVRRLIRNDGVDILILAGVTPVSDRKPRGWYVFCNGRMVLQADQSSRTGWGVNKHPDWHSKFNHFIGYLYFRSKDVRKLPWTTTKDDVTQESPAYQAALREMRVQIRPVLDFLNSLYGDVPEVSEPERKTLAETKPVDPQEVASRPNTTFEAKVRPEADDTLVNIQYKRTRRMINKVKTFLRKPTLGANKVGETTFDDFINRNCP